ncbi:MAG: hypothetical protein WD070_07340, partial [Pirellulaceae bacterium]
RMANAVQTMRFEDGIGLSILVRKRIFGEPMVFQEVLDLHGGVIARVQWFADVIVILRSRRLSKS